MELLIATKNKNKIEEIKNLFLKYSEIELITLNELNDFDEVDESEHTLEGNARLKAHYYYDKYHKPVFSDDTGLFVESLDGAPGVNSARYAGIGASYVERNSKLLHELMNVENRKAKFKCVICYIDENGNEHLFTGEINGSILKENKGSFGFGYDPLFYVDEINKTFSELTIEEKGNISHRGIALNEFLKYLIDNNRRNKILDYIHLKTNLHNPRVINRLLGGMSNYTYIIDSDEGKYTIRLPGENAEKFVNRSLEYNNIKIFEKLKITNETIYFNENDGVKIAKYIEGKPLSELKEYDYLKISQLLKIIHNSNKIVPNDYEPFERLDCYENHNKDLNYVFSIEYIETKKDLMQYKDYLLSIEKVICHGDSQPSNFIINENKLFIVDFEFAGNNDPIYDIACFANIRLEDGLKLLNTYYSKVEIEQLNRFYLWRAFQCLQWFNVAIYKELIGLSQKLHIDFLNVANFYLKLSIELLKKVKK